MLWESRPDQTDVVPHMTGNDFSAEYSFSF